MSTWRTHDPEIQQEMEYLRVRLRHCREKHVNRDHAFVEGSRADTYKGQAKHELVRRLYHEERERALLADQSKLHDILDIIQDLGDKCPELLRKYQAP